VVPHDAREFTGETNMISGRWSLVRGRAAEAGEFLEISPENLRSVIAKGAELSEIFMRACILRRLALITKGFGDVIRMGSRHCVRHVFMMTGAPNTAWLKDCVALDGKGFILTGHDLETNDESVMALSPGPIAA
jgi:hypothetical protein